MCSGELLDKALGSGIAPDAHHAVLVCAEQRVLTRIDKGTGAAGVAAQHVAAAGVPGTHADLVVARHDGRLAGGKACAGRGASSERVAQQTLLQCAVGAREEPM